MARKQKLMRVHPWRCNGTTAEFDVPASKPETQRALILGALAHGESHIERALRCTETQAMMDALIAIGADVNEVRISSDEQRISIVGTKLDSQRELPTIINAHGSALVARIFSVLGCLMPGWLIITSDGILARRQMAPLFHALRQAGGQLTYISTETNLPVLVKGGGLKSGSFHFPGNISSQFISALLIGGPLAQLPFTIAAERPILSASYIRQTIAAMKMAGVTVRHDQDLTCFSVPHVEYNPFTYTVSGDFTAASYCMAAAILTGRATILRHISSESLQGERQMISCLEALGASCKFSEGDTLTIAPAPLPLTGSHEFDVSDCPNILPTLAAVAAFVEGHVRIVGGSLTELHKAPRITAMAKELSKLGVRTSIIERNGKADGLEIHGRAGHEGGASLLSWHDHRIFMSLFVASLAMKNPNVIEGYDGVAASFPSFIDQFANNGVNYEFVS